MSYVLICSPSHMLQGRMASAASSPMASELRILVSSRISLVVL